MTTDSLVRIVLGVLLLAGVVAMVFVAVTPSHSRATYTELYILNESGVAANYPTDLVAGERATVVVGVGNYLTNTTSFTVLVMLDDRELNRYSLSVGRGATAERSVNFSLADPGSYRLDVHLFRGRQPTGDPLHTVSLQVHVAPRTPTPTPSGTSPSSNGTTG